MARSGPLLTEAQWKKIAPLLPKPPKHRKGGRPWIENRRVLEVILWILRSGARWQDLPETFPHPSTCWRRKNQAGQGDEVDGGGRRPRSSFGKLPSLCLPGGSPARGNDARDHPRR